MELQKQTNIAELADVDEDKRVEIEGFRTGTYLRIEVRDVPYEMVDNFNPFHPILVGGLALGEDSVGYMQVGIREYTEYNPFDAMCFISISLSYFGFNNYA